jgi:Cu(I)/Ag(I) efflux system membrane fusion protein
MYAEIEIAAGRRESATAVPSEAVIRSGTREKVFVQVGEGKFEPREVVLGLASKGWVEILEGVQEGESVVTSAQFLIDSESKLREAVAKMSAGTSQKDHSGHVMDHSDHEMELDRSGMNHQPDGTDHRSHEMSGETDNHEGHHHD